MNDLIRRQDAIQKMRDLYSEDLDAYGVEIPEMFDCDRAIEALQNLPSAEPEEKMGRWVQEWGVISNLSEKPNWVDTCNRCGSIGHRDMKYCPSCGARMIKLVDR